MSGVYCKQRPTNVKYTFDHQETHTYEDMTKPMRELMVRGAQFTWDNRREQAHQAIRCMMSDQTTLNPFDTQDLLRGELR